MLHLYLDKNSWWYCDETHHILSAYISWIILWETILVQYLHCWLTWLMKTNIIFQVSTEHIDIFLPILGEAWRNLFMWGLCVKHFVLWGLKMKINTNDLMKMILKLGKCPLCDSLNWKESWDCQMKLNTWLRHLTTLPTISRPTLSKNLMLCL